MEDLNNKLNSGDPVVVAQTVSKLVQIIKNKKENDILDVAEFKFLKEKCFSSSSAINVVAAEGILNIVRAGDCALVKSIITDLISVITTTKCSSDVAFLINSLLLVDLEKEMSLNNSYKSNFNLRLPQHPFIIMLNEDISYWSSVFREIMLSYRTADTSVISYYNELYKPVFLYTLCHPDGNHMLTFKQKLWSFLIQKEAVFRNDSNLVNTVLSWMQLESRDAIQVNSDFLIELSELNRQKCIIDPDLLLLWQISAIYQLILNNFDPRTMMFCAMNSLENVNNKIILNPILLTLAKCMSSCPSVYLLHLLKLSKVIISKAECDAVTKNIFKSSLLQWITNPSDLIGDSILYANNLFSLLQKQSEESRTRLKGFLQFIQNSQELISTNSEVYFSIQMYILLESWKTENDIISWLEKLENAPIFFIIKIFNFLTGLFLTEFEQTTITIRVFDLILKCVDYNKTLASDVLTVILFKLTNVTDSKIHYQLLKAVPTMAITKSNFQKIVGTIQALNKGRNTMKTFSTTLMLDLWKIDSKCYPYLENFLIAPYNNQGDRWEFFVTKAHILKELCAMKPELYGKEIVAHLSKILNECNNADGAIACALAIDGITLLCKSEIIDAVTTWATLEPMFKSENRVPVIKSLCLLIAEIPSLSYSEAYPKLTEDVVAKLWEYLLLNPSDEVWTATLSALTNFSTDQIVAQMPEEFFDEETLNTRRTGHVVPGHCWVRFLKNCAASKLKIAGNFLIKLISIEISNYLKFVYQVKGTREPADYSYLPVNSVVRGISTYIKSKMLKWKGSTNKEVYLQCLRTFSQKYSKPLPPLDWCFLQELFHEPEAKNFCVNIAAHQVVLSGTARRFVVNYIEALVQDHTNENDVLLIYCNLKHLANSVQPFTLKPFLEGTIYNAVELFKNGSEEVLNNILVHVKHTLKDEDIQEANKLVIAQIISDVFNESDNSSKLFQLLLECVILFPTQCINDMSSPKSVKEIGTEWFKRAVIIRCYLAINSSNAPLNVLNELMESGSSFTEYIPFIFEQFAAVFEKHKNNTDCVLWVLELIGQIQAITVEKSEQKEIFFLCNVFILAVVVFSGHSVFLKDFSDCESMYKLFPRAIATLLDVNHWSICTTQALEWFYHMYTEKMFHKEYRNMFAQCLQALRHETEFHKNMKWTKYLNSEC